nr:hypothetical protein HK105_006670 [Polyrhizophydium stewartii]
MQSAVLTQTLLASLDHVIYVHFVYLYLLDFRITLQAPLAQSMSVRAGIRNIILVNAVFALFHLFKGADGPPVIIDFFADAHTTATSRLFLVFIDLAVMGMQLFRAMLSTVYTMEFDVPGVVRSIIYEQRSRQPVRPSGGGGSGGTARSSTSTLDVSGFRATLNWRILRLNAQLRLGSAAERTTLLDASEADHGLAAAAGRDGRRHSDTDYERSSFTASEAGRDGDDAASDVSPEDAFYAHQGDIETGTAASGDPLLRRHAGQSGSRNLPV